MVTGGEIIAGAAMIKIFKFIWDNFGDEIKKSAAGKFADQWQKFKYKKATEEYTKKLTELYGNMRILGMTESMPIDQIYTNVNILTKPSEHWLIPEEQLKRMVVDGVPYGDHKKKCVPGREAFDKYSMLFILGKPGAGKTTFLKHLTIKAANGDINGVPIFISLRQFSESGLKLIDFIVEQFNICAFPEAKLFLEKILSEGKAIVLLDGLDEVVAARDMRRRTIDQIANFSNKYSDNRFVITCRIAATDYSFEKFDYVEMADFDENQSLAFISNWFRKKPKKREKFLVEYNRPENQRLLTLLCLTYEETLSFPAERSEIYKHALSALLSKWSASKNVKFDEIEDEIYKNMSVSRKEHMFSQIAAEAFDKDKYIFKQEELEASIVDYMKGLPNSPPHQDIPGKEVLRAIELQHGILVTRAQGLYSFSHLSFQEYYTSKYIIDNGERGSAKQLVKNHCFEKRWREVFLLTAEILPKQSTDALFNHFCRALDRFVSKNVRLVMLLTKVDQQSPKFIAKSVPFVTRSLKLTVILDASYYLVRATKSDLDLALNFARARASDRITELVFLQGESSHSESERARSREREHHRVLSRPRDVACARNLAHARELCQKMGLQKIQDYSDRLNVLIKATSFNDYYALVDRIWNIMQRNRDFKIYEFTEEDAKHIATYLEGVKLLLDCLKVAVVSDRQAIEDRLLRPPVKT